MPPRYHPHAEGDIPPPHPPPVPPTPSRFNRAGKAVGGTLVGMGVGLLVAGPIGLVVGGVVGGGAAAATGPPGGQQGHLPPGPTPGGAPPPEWHHHHHPEGPPPGQSLPDGDTPPPGWHHHHPPGGPPPGQPLPDSYNAAERRVMATPEEARVQASAPPVVEATAKAYPASTATK